MLKYYFDVAEKDSARLFKPYKIWQEEAYYTDQQGKYPVIHLSLKGGKAVTFEKSQQDIFNILRKKYLDFKWLLGENILEKEEEIDFKNIITGTASHTLYETSLKNLSEYLHRFYQQKVIVLIDEYDAPIHTAFLNGFYDKTIELMKSLMGHTLKDNDYVHKAVVTGILRIAKESIFSDLNNPGIFTLLSYDFADKFGFTEQETKDLLTYFELEQHFNKVKTWYDGYKMGEAEHIYNPWSVINYMAKYREGFKPYWANTSSDELIKNQIIEKDATEIRTSLEQLIQGEAIERNIEENIIFSDFYEDKEILWSLLVFSGYLSPIKKINYDEYLLAIPNYEIKTLFQKIVLDWLKQELKISHRTLKAMAKSLVKNDIPAFEKYFKRIMQDTFSYFDIHTEPERVYQAYVLGLLGILSDDYIIKSNRESGKGRYDILLSPRKIQDYGIIIEIKQLDKNASEAVIQNQIAEALNQIKKNKYQKELSEQGVKNLIEMAIVFVGKEVYLEVHS